MLYELFTHMELCTDEAVQKMLPLVSEQRREEALRYKHTFGQFCCLKSYCMLQTLVGSISPRLGYEALEFEYNENGKPSLKGQPEIYFNISHTKNAILVAISNEPIGVDVEAFRHPSDGLVEKTMNEEERALIASSANQDAMFTALWTKKEAVLKLRGTGIVDELHGVLRGDENGKESGEGVGRERVETVVFREKNFAMSFAKRNY